MKKLKNDYVIIFLFAILLSYLTYVYVLDALQDYLSDYNGHTFVYLPLFKRATWREGWMAVPYCMWHLCTLFFHRILRIPIETSAAYTACVFTLFSYGVIYWMIEKITERSGNQESSLRAALIAFGLCVVQPLHFYWLDVGDRFSGSFSMNPMHNPTGMCVRGFSLICICLVGDLWGYQKNSEYHGIFFRVENGAKKYYVYLAVTLFLSAMAKPTFAEMFIPAVGVVMLGEWIGRIVRKDGTAAQYFQHCLTTLICAVPTLLYILIQFLVYFIFGGSYGDGGSLILTKYLEVWSMYYENVGLSIVCGLAFPLFMLLINPGYFVKTDLGRLAIVGYAVGFLEAALLGESGEKLTHGDFMWPMMSGMLMLFVISTLRLLVLERTQTKTKRESFLVAIAWALFGIHVLYGILHLRG